MKTWALVCWCTYSKANQMIESDRDWTLHCLVRLTADIDKNFRVVVQRVHDQGDVIDNSDDDDRIELDLVETCYVCGPADQRNLQATELRGKRGGQKGMRDSVSTLDAPTLEIISNSMLSRFTLSCFWTTRKCSILFLFFFLLSSELRETWCQCQ